MYECMTYTYNGKRMELFRDASAMDCASQKLGGVRPEGIASLLVDDSSQVGIERRIQLVDGRGGCAGLSEVLVHVAREESSVHAAIVTISLLRDVMLLDLHQRRAHTAPATGECVASVPAAPTATHLPQSLRSVRGRTAPCVRGRPGIEVHRHAPRDVKV